MKVPTPKKLPSGMWRVQLQLGGERKSITRPTKKECETEARLIKAEYLAGRYEEPIEAPAETPTLGVCIDRYIDRRRNTLSPSTVRGYQAIKASRFLDKMDTPIDEVDWQAMINTEASKSVSPKTIKNAWGLIRSVLAENGMDVSVRLPAPTPHEKEFLDANQIRTFIDAVRDQPCEIGGLLALSSLRRSEIYGLDWQDVDLKNNVLHVRQSKVLGENAAPVVRQQNKTLSSTRDVPIFLPRLSEVLNSVEEKTGSVVPGNVGTLRKQLHRVCESADLPDIGVHGLRHSFASLCYSLGVSELAAMQLGGWSDYQTMRRIYTHLSEADRLKDAEKLTAFFQTPENAHGNAHETA